MYCRSPVVAGAEGSARCSDAGADDRAELVGLRVPAIAVELGCSQKTVRCWLHRFNRSGLQGLEDLGGQGRKRRMLPWVACLPIASISAVSTSAQTGWKAGIVARTSSLDIRVNSCQMKILQARIGSRRSTL
ncbi:helix-turn-helix domain-containing protein [Streptomyces sp. NPDC050625]|uniref:helix-turn-helix domain-containing protein n=1 Tax=Streptomyces sp. NPDC050625 TaxID=3154629 RepID=UPI00343F02F3